jgi:muconate cycloisomerase
MKVVRTEIIPITLTWKKPYAVPAHGVYPGDRVLVRVHTDEGVTGLGEAMTYPSYGETMESAVGALRIMAEILRGRDAFAPQAFWAKVDEVLAGQSMARDALDTALYDVAARKLGVPVSTLLGGRCHDTVPGCCSIGVATIEAGVEEAGRWAAQGVTQFHIKLMDYLGPRIDLEKVRQIRKVVGDSAAIRVDANGTYPPIRTLRMLDEYGIVMVEQPADKDDLSGLARYARDLDTPVLADESLLGLKRVHEVIRQEAADVITIKGYQIGGLTRAKQAEALIRAAGLPLFLGSGLKSSVGMAAHLQMCAAIRIDEWSYQEVALGLFNIQDDVVTEPLQFERGAFVVPQRPGIGVDIDERQLKKVMRTSGILTV